MRDVNIVLKGDLSPLRSTPWGNTPYKGLHKEGQPERGTFFRRQLYQRGEISRAEAYKR